VEGGARPAIGPGRLDAMHAASCACACESDVSVICVRLRVVAVLLKACGWRRQACSVSAESRLVLRVLSCRVLVSCVSVCGLPRDVSRSLARARSTWQSPMSRGESESAARHWDCGAERPHCGFFIWSVKSQNQSTTCEHNIL
jgi:hypothetical protein